MIIRDAELKDINNIVALHLRAFEGFFLTLLGKAFLELLYKEFILSESSLFLVVEDDTGIPVGFAVGTLKSDIFFNRLFKRRSYRFIISAIPSLLRNPRIVIAKLISAIFYRGDLPAIDKAVNPMLLSSIAVCPKIKGEGIGRKLMDTFEEKARMMEADCIYLTTDAHGNDHVNKFYLSAGFIVDGTLAKPGNRTMYRYIKFLKGV